MTEDEVTKVLGDLHTLHLVNEPNNSDDLIYSWLAFFSQDDARVIAKACYIYTKMKKNRFWPAPTDIEDLKDRAKMLVEMDDEEQRKKQQLSEVISELHELNLLVEPSDLKSEVDEWYRWFNSNSIEQIRTAVARYLQKFNDWPTPLQLSRLIPIAEEQKKLTALGGDPHTNKKLIKQSPIQPPRAPAIKIESRKCELHTGECILLDDLCDGPADGKCPFEGL